MVIVPDPGPVFPAATTTTTPSFHNRSTAKSSGSTAADCCDRVPQLRLTTRMPYWAWKEPTHCSAARTVETSVAPLRPATFTETSPALGAIPTNAPWLSRREAAPSPAMIPAMTVPWPNESSRLLPSPEKSGPATTRPARSATGWMPVSTTATRRPPPVTPLDHACPAPVDRG